MSRPFLAGVTAIALLLVSGVAIVAWVTRDDLSDAVGGDGSRPLAALAESTPAAGEDEPRPGMPAAPASPSVPLDPAPSTEAPAASRPPVAAAFPGAEARASAAARPLVPARTLKTDVPARQQRQRVSFRAELIHGLAAVERRAAGCAHGRPLPFVLQVESVDGAVRVVDAQLEPNGSASAAEVACVRSALQGQVVSVPTIEAGRRWRVPLAVGAET
jgi:hypothetical protein